MAFISGRTRSRKPEASTWSKVVAALEAGISFDGPGGKVTTQKNHHLTKNVYIGETKADGQFKIVESFDNVFGEPFLKGTFQEAKVSSAGASSKAP